MLHQVPIPFIGTSMGNISGFNSARLFVYDANNPSTLYIKVHLKQVANLLVFLGVFNVPDNISRIRVQFESLVSHDTYSGHRLLKAQITLWCRSCFC